MLVIFGIGCFGGCLNFWIGGLFFGFLCGWWGLVCCFFLCVLFWFLFFGCWVFVGGVGSVLGWVF